MNSRAGRISTLLSVLLVVLALAAFAAAPAGAKSMRDIAKAKVFNVGIVPYATDVIKDPKTGEYKGVFVDAMRWVCGRIKVKCVFKEFSWATFIAALQSRQIDLSIASTYATVPRAMVVNFSRPIYYLGYKALARKGDNRFKTVEDLDNPNVSISVCQGCGQMEWLQRKAPKAKLRVVKTEELAIMDLLGGSADVAVGASAPVNHALATQPGLQLVLGGRIYSQNQVAWAINKGDQDILNFINVAIGQLISTGKLLELAKKYKVPWMNDLAF